MELTGRVAVVTGGVSGIGAATAERLRSAGATVVTWDLSAAADVRVDTSREHEVEAAIAGTKQRWGVPTVLVAAAGIGRTGSLIDTTVEQWDHIFDTNVKGVWLSMRAVAREIRDAGLDGSIVAVSSIQGVLADPYLAAYSATKAAVLHLGRLAAVEWGGYGIRVNAVGPGATLTPMLQKSIDADPSYADGIARTTPLGRIGTADDVAEGILRVQRDADDGGLVVLDVDPLVVGREHGRHRRSPRSGRRGDGKAG